MKTELQSLISNKLNAFSNQTSSVCLLRSLFESTSTERSHHVFSLLVFVLLAVIPSIKNLHSQELYDVYPAPRALGMGGAFTAVANDESAVWTNPAGLSKARKFRTRNFFRFKFPQIGIAANSEGGAILDAYANSDTATLSESIAGQDLSEGQTYYAAANLSTFMMFDYDKQAPGSFGLYSTTSTLMRIEPDTSDQIRVSMNSDAGLSTSFAWTNSQNQFAFGLTLRTVSRTSYEDYLALTELDDQTTLETKLQTDFSQGFGLGVDMGILYTLSDFWFPTIGVSIINVPTGCLDDILNPHTLKRETVCGNVYQGEFTNPETLAVIDPTDIRFGMAISPRLSRTLALRVALDVHHYPIKVSGKNLGFSGVEFAKMSHAGIEIYTGNPLSQGDFSIRAGLNQGYPTAGITMEKGVFQVEAAYYGVDVGGYKNSVQDARYITSLSMVY